ncbi:DNA polymerase III subunit gamma and tau [Arcanobacterium phocae]|uniref:DNA polymerase III subunit gamma and tau n=1 Tax=Arcanobacterium phocae TaxID=131112 RepID=UPI0020A163D9|nr:DNA polymerase III subunit gamma and tau [Arcanobacterium phocae]
MTSQVWEGSSKMVFVSVAMYRRYRPQSFQEVIGQDHVVAPLRAALAAGRTTHAYLFSGPRGCGKTTSARILARCLNCVNYPTDTPCGVCDSCRDLARDGAGSLDVVELDAASHGGVDDARELREQAGFAPVRDRFKIFIIDEAHMVSNQGFNALLKLVEEPPEHVKFIFATTEPEKVIGTIRSRTHHYPFRLVPPLELEKYLARICAQEGVSASKDVLSLVIRAGTGSVRDTLSVLDQIIGGSDSHSLDYDRAVALLGYTSAHLLDDAVSAVAERDGGKLFNVVDSVVKSGHDPRRFVEDLLQRLRDVVIIALTGEAARDVFVSVPDDQFERMTEQAEQLGAARASRCADITNEALNMMVGATAPRLQLELLCARLVVAQAEGRTDSAPTQMKVATEGAQVSTPPQVLSKWKKPSVKEAVASRRTMEAVPEPQPQQSLVATIPTEQKSDSELPPTHTPAVASVQAESPKPVTQPAQPTVPERQPEPVHAPRVPAPVQPPHVQAPPVPPAHLTQLPDSAAVQARVATADPAHTMLNKIVSAWGDILAHPKLGGLVRNQLKSGARPVDVVDNTLHIGFAMPAVALRFNQRRSGDHVTDVIRDLLQIGVSVEAIPDDGTTAPKVEAAREDFASVSPEPAAPRSDTDVNVPTNDSATVEPDFDDSWVEEENLTEIHVTTDVTSTDPAGVLGALVDGQAQFNGEDHVQSPHSPDLDPIVVPEEHQDPSGSSAKSDLVPPEVPFFAQPMPEIPPVTYPGTATEGARANGEKSWHSSEIRDNKPAASSITPVPANLVRPGEARPVWEVHPPVKSQEEPPSEWEEVSEDDPDISESSLVGLKVLLGTFDGRIIEEIPDGNGGN